MPTFAQELQSFEQTGYIELFDLDTTQIDSGGGTIYRFTPHNYSSTPIAWRSNSYTPFPIEATGFEWSGTTNAPPKPVLTIANTNSFILADIIALGDLTGAKLTRWRTFSRFLDGQPGADPNAYFPTDVFLIDQKTTHNKEVVSWSLISLLDRQGMYLPRRQILKDDNSSGVYFPGVARTRI